MANAKVVVIGAGAAAVVGRTPLGRAALVGDVLTNGIRFVGMLLTWSSPGCSGLAPATGHPYRPCKKT